jgi:excisionase family DNA binding protein
MSSLAYSLAEAACRLGVHRSSLYRKIVAGEIKVLAGLGLARIPAAEIDRYLAATILPETDKGGQK